MHINNNKPESLNVCTDQLKPPALDNQKSNFTKVFKQQKSKAAE